MNVWHTLGVLCVGWLFLDALLVLAALALTKGRAWYDDGTDAVGGAECVCAGNDGHGEEQAR